MVLFNDIRRNGLCQVVELKEFERQIINAAIETRPGVKGEGVGNTFLTQQPFFLFVGHRAPWPDANMHSTFITHWRQVGRLDFNDGNVSSG